MKKIQKVLFVPCPSGGSAHFIPLVALDRMLKGTGIETAFLVSRSLRALAELFRLKTLDLEHQSLGAPAFRTEMRAYSSFDPDVVIDDTCLTTGFATALARKPRVTLQRTGTFPHSPAHDPRHHHSLEGMNFDWSQLPDVTFLGLQQPRTLSDLFTASCTIVPGIRSIEHLPPPLAGDDSYFFSGPLLVEDFLIEAQANGAAGLADSARAPSSGAPSANLEKVRSFLAQHAGRPRVYVTLGTVASATEALRNSIRRLLERGMAVLSTVDVQDLSEAQRARFFHGMHLPMHLAVGNADLIVHQCGSGTYQYPLLHAVPSLTIGTQCHDREEVAKRLEALGASIHLASAAEEPAFEARFVSAIDHYFACDGARLAEGRQRLRALREETERTSAEFDLERVLALAVATAHSIPNFKRL